MNININDQNADEEVHLEGNNIQNETETETTSAEWKHQKEPRQTRNKPATKINMEELKQDVVNRPDAYLEERAKTFNVSISCIFYALRRLNIRYKKNAKSP